ncbi:BnaC03g42510D [Brassica napus]|uniref:BnaC03g42510D protein n=1 Tax=Brassica napus TaxID=3708 RepID=A0A078GI23_BRANA|nr:BnaC03g42510D [Brassica napus]
MPSQWGMEDRITANDLGNGNFLLYFTTEDDLNSVLLHGPFHFKFCMFVLVRWEPIVHDDYPWIIPFWTRLIGVPLHLWTGNNLKGIGSRLGHVHHDTIELMEGRMLIDIDTRRPLKFARKAESPEGDEVTIEIKYEMLFKHCSTCGMLTHKKEYCPSSNIQAMILPQVNRHGVFTRVQVPEVRSQYQSVKKEPQKKAQITSSSLSYSDHKSRHFNDSRYGHSERRYDPELASSRDESRGHADRIIRRRSDLSRSSRYGDVEKNRVKNFNAAWSNAGSSTRSHKLEESSEIQRGKMTRVGVDRLNPRHEEAGRSHAGRSHAGSITRAHDRKDRRSDAG